VIGELLGLLLVTFRLKTRDKQVWIFFPKYVQYLLSSVYQYLLWNFNFLMFISFNFVFILPFLLL
jgi:hypothetical protein